jgi:alpha-methylacyl-CoA racemase
MLDGITVLDLASVGPAARASRWLSDYGAAVIKVGPVPSDQGVQIVPPFHAYSAHRGMRRIQLDLKVPAGRDAFLRVAADADVIIESFRPGVVDRLGIGYETVRADNPGIVYCSTTGYGQDGPQAAWAGHDLNYLAVSGFLDCSTRGPEGQPPIPGATVADSAGGGMHAVIAILAALVRRSATGQGGYLDVSVADGMLALMALQIDEYLADGTIPGPGRSLLTGRYACYSVYATSDGGWLSVAAIEPRFWANLCHKTGLEKHVDDQFTDDAQDQVRADLTTVFKTRTRDEWVAELAPADTCVAPVLSVPEVVADPQFLARSVFTNAVHPDRGPFDQVGSVLAGMQPPDKDLPTGSQTDQILEAAGFTQREVDELRRQGVLA